MNYPHRHFGPKKPTKADTAAALTSVLVMRTKPYSERDIEFVARTHQSTPAEIKAKLRELGRGHLIQEPWRG